MLSIVCSCAAAQKSDYQAGIDAYFERDYEGAKRHWLNGAKNDDARSMFNLGLLHEQKKISRADTVKASKWYRLAGKHGYAAADYHLASLLRVREGASEEAQSLLERSAENGYGPARQALGLKVNSTPTVANTASLTGTKSDPVKTLVSDSAVALDSVPSANKSANKSADKYLGEAWIKAQSKSHWTVQMLAFEELAKVMAFIDEHGIRNNAAYFIERTDQGVLYKLIFGSFDSKEEADQARKNLSKELKEYGPWLRPIENVQASLN